MGRKQKISFKKKLKLVKERLENGISLTSLGNKYKISTTTVIKYINLYLKHGENGLLPVGKRNRTYSLSFKEELVQKYFTGSSPGCLAIQYNISVSVVTNWITLYNKNQLKKYIPQGEIYTMASKKYTKIEKQMIIQECILTNKDYKTIAAKYNIRYSLLYQWVKSYEKKEKQKPLQLAKSKEEEFEIRLKYKEMQIEALQRELEILKKNDEIYEMLQRKKSKRNI